MKAPGKEVKARLIEIRKAIKRKYRAFKDGTEETDLLLERQYKPIITELRKTTPASTDIKSEQNTVKAEPEEEPMEYESGSDDDDEKEAPTPFAASTPSKTLQLSDFVSTPLAEQSTTEYIKQHFKNPVTRKYMTALFKNATGNNEAIDNTFGPRYENDTLMVGSEPLDFDTNGNLLIGDVNYGSSEGLYELIFKKYPRRELFSEEDLNTYRSILFATNAHREGNKHDGKLKAPRDSKYRNVIKNLFPSQGKGMLWKVQNTRDIIHWDDPNELIDRLRHIAMSTESGNRVHTNEILSIIEEVREAGYIKGAGNSRFKALLK